MVNEVFRRVDADERVSRVLDGNDSEARLAYVEVRAVEAFLGIQEKAMSISVSEKTGEKYPPSECP